MHCLVVKLDTELLALTLGQTWTTWTTWTVMSKSSSGGKIPKTKIGTTRSDSSAGSASRRGLFDLCQIPTDSLSALSFSGCVGTGCAKHITQMGIRIFKVRMAELRYA